VRTTFRYFVRLLVPHKRLYVQLLLTQVAMAVIALSLPLVSGCVIGTLSERGRPDAVCRAILPGLTGGRLAGVAAILLLVFLVRVGVALRRTYLENRLFRGIETSLQEAMFAHLQRLSHAFYTDARVGDLAARLLSDIRNITGAMGQIFGVSAALALTALAAALTALAKSPPLGALMLLVVPVLLVCNRVLGARMMLAGQECATLTGDAASVLHENLAAHSLVKAFGLEGRQTGTFARHLSGVLRASLRVALARQLFQATALLTITLAEVTVLALGGYLVLRGTIADPGTLVTFLALLPLMLDPLPNLAAASEAAHEVAGSIQRVAEVFDRRIDIQDVPGATPLPAPSSEIRFENVSFGYTSDRPVLQNLDLVIPVGSFVAVVGPSGSGKTTLVNLLMRFWDPDEGRIVIDGHDLRKVTLSSLRSQIGFVSQDTFVFNTTLGDNITIGRPGATNAEVETAARAARLDASALPAGYETTIGEWGARLSGGQRQRLAIARALLRDPALLLLDEPTSALDARNEAAIVDTLRSVARGRTTLAMTHRLALAAAADTVVVLDQGRSVECGPHAQLVGAGGLYQQLWEKQTASALNGEPDKRPNGSGPAPASAPSSGP
jgi:ATP-binding cassette, subfamily B, bacterial